MAPENDSPSSRLPDRRQNDRRQAPRRQAPRRQQDYFLLHRERQLDAARRISEALFQSADLDEVIRKALSTALEVVGADAGSLLLADPDARELVFCYVIGEKADFLLGKRMPWDKGVAGAVFTSGQPEIVNDVKQDDRHFSEIDQASGYKSRDMIVLPLRRWGGEPIGVLEVLNKVDGRLDHYDVDILTVISALSAAAIEQKGATELSRRHQEEQHQSQKLDSLGRLAGGIAHEFNNLLTVIVGYSDLMLAELPTGDPRRERLEQIKTAGGRASSLTQQLLAFSRRQVVQPSLIDLNTEVEQSERVLRWLVDEQIQIVHQLDSRLGQIKADQGQIKHVLMNLAINAKDAMPNGGILTIRTANVDVERATAREHRVQPGVYVMLSVQDNGLGMDDEARAHLFEPFFTTKGLAEGTGLGLAAVYGILSQNGGFIEVETAPQRGTTFRLYFPLIQQKEAPITDPSPSPQASGTRTATILVVDDELTIRTLIRSVLMAEGYTILEASEGEEALQVCRQHDGTIHLLLSDVIMPGITGVPLIEQIKSLRPDIKILFMSGYTDDALGRQGVLASGISYIQKPFMPADLLRKVYDILESQS